MPLSNTVVQYRQEEAQTIRQFLTYSLIGSFLVHGGLFLVRLRDRPLREPEEIVMVVTEPLIPEPEEIPEPSPLEDPILTSEAPPTAEADPSEMIAADLPIPEPVEPVLPDVTDVPLEEAVEDLPVEETAVEDPISETTEVTDNPEAEPEETETAAATTTEASENESTARSLNDLLSEIRRARQNARENAAPTTGRSTSDTPSGGSDAPETAAAPAPPAPPPAPESQQISCGNCPQPRYPRSALNAGVEGSVRVSVDVDEAGRVISVTLIGTSGSPELDQAVMDTVRRQWQFQGTNGGASNIPVQVDMTLEGSDFNREATQRGNREEITVPSAAPVGEEAVEEVPESIAEPPMAAPSVGDSSAPSPTSAPETAPSEDTRDTVTPESVTPESVTPESTMEAPMIEGPGVEAGPTEVDPGFDSPEPVFEPAPEPVFEPAPEPVFEPRPLPEAPPPAELTLPEAPIAE
jgi:TonB family protein